MVDELVRAICSALNKEFNADNHTYQIIDSPNLQGLKLPAFTVNNIQSIIDVKGIQAFKNSYLYEVRYHSNEKNAYKDCLNILERVCIALKTVTISDIKAHCLSFKSKIVDDVLVITCTYDMKLLRQAEKAETMQTHKVVFND